MSGGGGAVSAPPAAPPAAPKAVAVMAANGAAAPKEVVTANPLVAARPDGLLAELRSAAQQGCGTVIWVAWRYLSLNVLVETLSDRDIYGDLSALTGVYNLIALIEALLLGVGIGPFMDMNNLNETYGDVPLVRFNNVMIMCVMGFSLINLCIIVLLTFYISSVHRARRHLEVRNFPLFGLALWCVVFSVITALLWTIANCYLTLPPGYAYFAAAVVALMVIIGAPLLMYGFFFRLPAMRAAPDEAFIKHHGLLPEPSDEYVKISDLMRCELEAIIAQAGSGGRKTQ